MTGYNSNPKNRRYMPKFDDPVFSRPGKLAGVWTLACLLSLGGCGQSPAAPEKPAVPETAAVAEQTAERQPVHWKLGPEAEHFYYYLLFSEAMHQNDTDLLAEATMGLLKLEPSLPIFQDGASIFLIRRDFAKAENIIRQGLAHFPGDPTLTVFLSGVFSETGQEANALALLEEFLKTHPENPPGEVSQELVRLYLREGLTDRAQKILAGYAKGNMPPAVVFFQAKLHIANNELDKAQKVLRGLTRAYPEFPEAWIELGLLAEKRKNTEEAVNAFKRAVQLVADGQDLLFRIILLQMGSGNLAGALNTARLGQGVGQDAVQTAGAFQLQAALLFAEKGHFPEAEVLLQDAVANGADRDEAAMYQSTILYSSTGDPMQAAAPLTGVGRDSEFYTKARQRLVHLYLRADKNEEAHATATALRKELPDNPEHWSLESYSLVQLGKKDEAVRLLSEEVQRRPDDADLLFAKGSIYDTLGQREEALRVMETIITKHPRHARALNYIGYSLAEDNKDLDRALRLIKTALEELPDAEYIVDSLAWAHFRRGEFASAWEAIQKCMTLADEDAVVWEHYAEIALAVGQTDEAIRGLTEALKLGPENALELAAKLKKLQEGE